MRKPEKDRNERSSVSDTNGQERKVVQQYEGVKIILVYLLESIRRTEPHGCHFFTVEQWVNLYRMWYSIFCVECDWTRKDIVEIEGWMELWCNRSCTEKQADWRSPQKTSRGESSLSLFSFFPLTDLSFTDLSFTSLSLGHRGLQCRLKRAAD